MTNNKYDDIINLPHYEPKNHKRMSNLNRAAQFAPFAALSGHEEAVVETARKTDQKIMLDESELEILDQKIQIIEENIALRPLVKITYYIPDDMKNGGAYIEVEEKIKKIDLIENVIILENQIKIHVDDIYRIEGEIFNNFEF